MSAVNERRRRLAHVLLDDVFVDLKKKYFRIKPFSHNQASWINLIIESRLDELKIQAKIDAPLFDTLIIDEFTSPEKNSLDHYLDCAQCIDSMLKRSNMDPKNPTPQFLIIIESMRAIERQIETLLKVRTNNQLKRLLGAEFPDTLCALKTIRRGGLMRWSNTQLGIRLRIRKFQSNRLRLKP